MIYLQKGDANAQTTCEELAIEFEKQGFVRLTGRKHFGKVLLNATKKAILHLVIPALAASALFSAMDGTEFAPFVIGIFAFSVVRDWFD